MLWGILNAVISARYISRKVSENCFVLLEQRLGNELTGFSWQSFSRLLGHLYTVCGPPLHARLSRSKPAVLSQVLIGVKKKEVYHGGKSNFSEFVAMY